MNDIAFYDAGQLALHPGQLLREDFLEPMHLSPTRVAHDIGVPLRRLQSIIAERAPIDADIALRLACYFRTTPQFWAQMQANHDLDRANRKHGDSIRRQIRPCHDYA